MQILLHLCCFSKIGNYNVFLLNKEVKLRETIKMQFLDIYKRALGLYILTFFVLYIRVCAVRKIEGLWARKQERRKKATGKLTTLNKNIYSYYKIDENYVYSRKNRKKLLYSFSFHHNNVFICALYAVEMNRQCIV